MDGRQHSVDVPLSRTLIALRRVRSLRDPSTNSMSKLNALVDNVNWEAYSNDAVTIGAENSCHRVSEGDDDGIGLRSSTLVKGEEHGMDEHKLYLLCIYTTMADLNFADGDFLSSSSTGDSFKRSVACACGDTEYANSDTKYDRETLDLVWIRAAGMCASSSLKKFLLKRGNLASVRLSQGKSARFLPRASHMLCSSSRVLDRATRIAVVELEFDHPDYASTAEKSWKEIAGALQLILGYNVELRINLARDGSSRNGNAKKPCLSLLNCSRRVLFMSKSSAESGANGSSNSGSTLTTVRTRDKYMEMCSSECTSQVSCSC